MTLLADARHASGCSAKAPCSPPLPCCRSALGVAATSAIFSLADALLAAAAGVRDAARVVDVGRGNDGSGFDNLSHPAFEYLRAHAASFDGLAGVEFGGRPMGLTLGDSTERVFGNLVSANFFDVLGRRQLGSGPSRRHHRPDARPPRRVSA